MYVESKNKKEKDTLHENVKNFYYNNFNESLNNLKLTPVNKELILSINILLKVIGNFPILKLNIIENIDKLNNDDIETIIEKLYDKFRILDDIKQTKSNNKDNKDNKDNNYLFHL